MASSVARLALYLADSSTGPAVKRGALLLYRHRTPGPSLYPSEGRSQKFPLFPLRTSYTQ